MAVTSLQILCTCAKSLSWSYKILEEEKYTSHTIACLAIFMCPFCHTHVENLLKGAAPLLLLLHSPSIYPTLHSNFKSSIANSIYVIVAERFQAKGLNPKQKVCLIYPLLIHKAMQQSVKYECKREWNNFRNNFYCLPMFQCTYTIVKRQVENCLFANWKHFRFLCLALLFYHLVF